MAAQGDIFIGLQHTSSEDILLSPRSFYSVIFSTVTRASTAEIELRSR